jgi:hypothetical protein
MKTFLKFLFLAPVVAVVIIIGAFFWLRHKGPSLHFLTGRPFASVAITNLTANFFTPEGKLGPAANDVYIEFRDGAGKLKDVGNVEFGIGLESPGTITHSTSIVLPTATRGQYRANVTPQIVGEWKATLSIFSTNGPKADFVLTVK